MSGVIKAVLKGLTEKKARTFLVLFSIAVSAALIFANQCFSLAVTQRFYEADVRFSGISDFRIHSRDAVGAEEWIDTTRLEPYRDKLEYIYPFIQEEALYIPSVEEMHYFTIIGADIAAFNHHNPVTLREGSLDGFEGFSIIIGATYADIFGLKSGDTMTLELNGQSYDFRIAGISAPKGQFLRELADGGFILAPKETVSKIFGGDSNLVYMKMFDRATRTEMKETLTAALPEYEVEYGINDEVIAAETQNYVLPFNISSVVVILMSVFIIFTSFNLISLERIPLIGTLRSVGCSKKRVNAILLTESALLGAVSGLIGCFLGIGVLQLIKSFYFTGDDAILNSTIAFGAREVITTVIAAVVITVVSAILPIVRTTRIPVKNIILNDIGGKSGRKSGLWIVGAILLLACLIVPQFLKIGFTGMMIGAGVATGALVGLILIIPALTRLVSRIVSHIPGLPYERVLGIRNMSDSKILVNSIQLFAASIAIVAFMTSMFSTMKADLLRAFDRDMKFDVVLSMRNSDPESLGRLEEVEGVGSFAGCHVSHAAILNLGTFINALYGIDDARFFDYNPVGDLEMNEKALNELNSGKNIITSNVMKSKFGLKLGDRLLIQFGSSEVEYTVTGFVETNVGIGHVGYISSENYRADIGAAQYDKIFVKAEAEPDDAKLSIKRALTRDIVRIETKAELNAANADKVMGMFKAISSYSYLALLIGIIGIVNNIGAGFLVRKRSFAMLRCVGMSRKGLRKMLVMESAAMGLLGVAAGLACTLIMSAAIPASVSAMWGRVTVRLALTEMLVMGLAGIAAMLCVSAVPVAGSNKMSIVESIKYE